MSSGLTRSWPLSLGLLDGDLPFVLDAAFSLGLVLGTLGLSLVEVALLVPCLVVLDTHFLGLEVDLEDPGLLLLVLDANALGIGL